MLTAPKGACSPPRNSCTHRQRRVSVRRSERKRGRGTTLTAASFHLPNWSTAHSTRGISLEACIFQCYWQKQKLKTTRPSNNREFAKTILIQPCNIILKLHCRIIFHYIEIRSFIAMTIRYVFLKKGMHRIVQFEKEERERICIFPDVDPKVIKLFLGGLIIADFYFLPFVIHIV